MTPTSIKRLLKGSFKNRMAGCMLMLAAMATVTPSCTLLKKGGRKKKKAETGAAVNSGVTPGNNVPGTLAANDSLNVILQPPATLQPSGAAQELANTLAPLWSRRMSYHTFSGKAKVNFRGPDKSADFSANFRIAKDSIMWVHVTALGGLYPVARMLVTRDSFFMVDHIQKEVTMLPLADVGKVLPVTVQLAQLQNLLTGDPLSDGSAIAAEKKETLWSVTTQDTAYTQQLSYKMVDSMLAVADLRTRKAGGPQALLSYSNYEPVMGRMLSMHRTVNVQNNLDSYNLEMDIVNPEFDRALEYPFSIPKNYSVKVR